MAGYTVKELKDMSTEELIASLMLTADSMSKATKSKEEKIVKVLSERGIIDEQTMKETLERKHIW